MKIRIWKNKWKEVKKNEKDDVNYPEKNKLT